MQLHMEACLGCNLVIYKAKGIVTRFNEFVTKICFVMNENLVYTCWYHNVTVRSSTYGKTEQLYELASIKLHFIS